MAQNQNRNYNMPSLAPLPQPKPVTYQPQVNNPYQVQNQSQSRTLNLPGNTYKPPQSPVQGQGRATHFTGSQYIGPKQAQVTNGVGRQPAAPWTQPTQQYINNDPKPLAGYDALGLSAPSDPRNTLGLNTQQGQTLWNAVNGWTNPFPSQNYTYQNGYWANTPQDDVVSRIQGLNSLSNKGINVPQYDPLTGYILNNQGGPGMFMGLGDYINTPEATAGYPQNPYVNKPQYQNPFSLSPGQGFNPSVGVFGPQGTNVQSNFAGGNMNGMNTVQGAGMQGPIGTGQPITQWTSPNNPYNPANKPVPKNRLAGMGNSNAALGRRSNFALR